MKEIKGLRNYLKIWVKSITVPLKLLEITLLIDKHMKLT